MLSDMAYVRRVPIKHCLWLSPNGRLAPGARGGGDCMFPIRDLLHEAS
jgi:hypothetical protein